MFYLFLYNEVTCNAARQTSLCFFIIISFTLFYQHWEYDKSSNRIRHAGSGNCLDSKDHKEKGLVLNGCSDSFTQVWQFEVIL